jgi:hypothetical protein
MTFKRKALGALTRAELLEVGKTLDLGVTSGMRLDEMMDVVAGSKKRGVLEKTLDLLARDTLKSVCFAVGISAEGREKQVLVDRILAAERGGDGDGDGETPEPKAKKAQARKEEAPKVEPTVTPAPPAPAQTQLAWQGFPLLEPTPPPVTRSVRTPVLPAPNTTDANATASEGTGLEITLDVTPRKPRLAWQGMWRKEMATSVPTQVVEIVRPGRAMGKPLTGRGDAHG